MSCCRYCGGPPISFTSPMLTEGTEGQCGSCFTKGNEAFFKYCEECRGFVAHSVYPAHMHTTPIDDFGFMDDLNSGTTFSRPHASSDVSMFSLGGGGEDDDDEGGPRWCCKAKGCKLPLKFELTGELPADGTQAVCENCRDNGKKQKRQYTYQYCATCAKFYQAHDMIRHDKGKKHQQALAKKNGMTTPAEVATNDVVARSGVKAASPRSPKTTRLPSPKNSPKLASIPSPAAATGFFAEEKKSAVNSPVTANNQLRTNIIAKPSPVPARARAASLESESSNDGDDAPDFNPRALRMSWRTSLTTEVMNKRTSSGELPSMSLRKSSLGLLSGRLPMSSGGEKDADDGAAWNSLEPLSRRSSAAGTTYRRISQGVIADPRFFTDSDIHLLATLDNDNFGDDGDGNTIMEDEAEEEEYKSYKDMETMASKMSLHSGLMSPHYTPPSTLSPAAPFIDNYSGGDVTLVLSSEDGEVKHSIRVNSMLDSLANIRDRLVASKYFKNKNIVFISPNDDDEEIDTTFESLTFAYEYTANGFLVYRPAGSPDSHKARRRGESWLREDEMVFDLRADGGGRKKRCFTVG